MNRIPKIIHYCWVGGSPKPQSVIYCINSWKKYCPDYEIKEWNETNYDFTQNKYMKEAYESKKWGFVPDYARVDIIYKYGGIYFDTDVELIKNIDFLLEQSAFMGFENTGDGEFFVNCGQGFGAIPYHPIIKSIRDSYNNKRFIENDNSFNMLPSPHYTTQSLCQYGLVRKNMDQKLPNMIVYASDVSCPKNFRTGKIKKTDRSISIHHFTASWLDERIKNELLHQQFIYDKFGKKIGRYVLYLESVIKKYKSKGIKQFIYMFFYRIKKYFIELRENYIFKKYLKITKKTKIGDNNFIILDTYLDGDNEGDRIIMDSCLKQLSYLFQIKNLIHIPTHRFITEKEEEQLIGAKGKILCGTNILSGNMKNYGLWRLKPNVIPYKNTILLGVGFDSESTTYDEYTKELFNVILSKKYLHSVRDSFSEHKLKEMGVHNVINTGCPTMWELTPEHCAEIPTRKSKKVVCTITDYNRDIEKDIEMINILCKNYKEIYLWIQGKEDLNYIEELKIPKEIIIVEKGVKNFDSLLMNNDIDYIGTRLHAGIRALHLKKRSIIISIDNRAKCISQDTNLITIDRRDISLNLNRLINSNFETKITLPIENIEMWKKQFKRYL